MPNFRRQSRCRAPYLGALSMLLAAAIFASIFLASWTAYRRCTTALQTSYARKIAGERPVKSSIARRYAPLYKHQLLVPPYENQLHQNQLYVPPYQDQLPAPTVPTAEPHHNESSSPATSRCPPHSPTIPLYILFSVTTYLSITALIQSINLTAPRRSLVATTGAALAGSICASVTLVVLGSVGVLDPILLRLDTLAVCSFSMGVYLLWMAGWVFGVGFLMGGGEGKRGVHGLEGGEGLEGLEGLGMRVGG